jgi:hypothetical protein
MTQSSVPESRAYRHTKCGGETVISGPAFETASNPLSDMTRTWCTPCNAFFPITEIEWLDTGETIAKYYERHGAKASSFDRFLCSKNFLLGSVAVGLLVGAGVGYYLFRDRAAGAKFLMTAFVGFLGVFAAAALNVSVITKLITKKVCGVSDTRELK